MRWTTTEAERLSAELELGLRIAGVGELFEFLVSLGEIADPSAWCSGLVDGRGAVLVAVADRIDHYGAGSGGGTGVGTATPQVLTSALADVTELRVHPTFDGFALRVEGRAPLVIRDVPRLQLPAFVAHLIAFIPSTTSVTPSITPSITSPTGDIS